jgi:putative transposase
MCRVLGVSTSGYYAWRNRDPSRRAQENAELLEQILIIHTWSRRTFGAPRIHTKLVEKSIQVGHNRVARLMRRAGIQGVTRRKRHGTTRRNPEAQPADDLVNRQFTRTAPNQLWVADITYVPTKEGFLYLAVVVDAFSRRVVGWAMATRMKTRLVLDALEMAIGQRHPEGVIHHSDHGSQYTSVEFGRRCRKAGIRPSMGSVGDCFDNALCESFFATLECELIDRHQFFTQAEAQRAVFDFIEGWYNLHRLHSSLGYDTPAHYEKRYATRIAAERKEEVMHAETRCERTAGDIKQVLAGTSRMSSATLSAKPG